MPRDIPSAAPGRGRLVRDLIVFQGKLFLDGFRDLLLSPVSLFLGLIDLLSLPVGTPRFYRLLQLGRRSDHWINLFGAAGAEHEDDTAENQAAHNVDDVVARLENTLRDELRHGKLSAGTKQLLERRLAGLRDRLRLPDADPPADGD